MTPVAPRTVNDVSYVMRTKMLVFLRDRRSICCGWIVTPVVPRTVNDVFADCNDCACYV